MLGCRRVVVAQWSERRQLRSDALGSIPSGYPCIFSSVCFYPDLPPVAYDQFLPPVVVNQNSNHVYVPCSGKEPSRRVKFHSCHSLIVTLQFPHRGVTVRAGVEV